MLTWGKTKKLWKEAWDQYGNRNAALHETPLAIELGVNLSLDKTIRDECTRGCVELPHKIQNSKFSRDTDPDWWTNSGLESMVYFSECVSGNSINPDTNIDKFYILDLHYVNG